VSRRTQLAGSAGGRDDNALFRELYGRCYRPIRDYCRRRLPHDVVDDAVAEVFLTAWRRLDDVPDGDAALLWLYGVAYRVVGHERRSTARRRQLGARMQSAVGRPVSAADERVVEEDECRIVLDAVAGLNETDAEVLLLVAWERLSVGDIAAALQIAPNAVAQRLHRARRNLGREYRRLQSRSISTPIAPTGGGR
jgi:RNA polymerase sigma-70 factor (ECF subfamily)